MEISVVALLERFVGAIVVSMSCAVLFWKLGEGISHEAKSSLSDWLNNLKPKHLRPNTIEIFQFMIDKVFGGSHFSIQCLVRSSLLSMSFAIVVYILLTLNFGYTPSLFAAARKYSDFWVLFAVMITWNILADYFSLLKSRIMVFYMSRKKWVVSVILLFFCDLLLTLMIFAIVLQIVLQSVPQVLLGAGYGIVYDRDPVYAFYFHEAPEATLALFITTFFTSVWALIYAVSLLSLKIIGMLKRVLNFSLWLLPVSTHPLRAIGLTAAANAFLVAIAFPHITMSLYHFMSDFASVHRGIRRCECHCGHARSRGQKRRFWD